MTNQEFINRVLELTNAERARVGLAPLTLNSSLATAAQTHSQNMASQDFFSHTGLDGSSPTDRARIAGYSGGASENIGVGYTSAEAAVNGWMNSPGHRENILNPDYRSIGIGYYFLENDTGSVNYNHYWTQTFGLVATAGVTPPNSSSFTSTNLATEGVDNLQLGVGNDVLFALGGNDIIRGGAGDDSVNGMRDNDQVFGEVGNDSVRGGKGSDLVTGDDGNDSVFGDLDNDQVYGGNGDDTLYGGRNDDLLDGGIGNDLLYGDLGADTIIGGVGNDLFVLRPDDTGVNVVFYNDTEDFLGLTGGLSLNNLLITQGTGANVNDTLIQVANTGQVLAILPSVSATLIDPGDFVSV